MAYSPPDRECKISKFDQRDSRILYDANFDYYENLVGKLFRFSCLCVISTGVASSPHGVIFHCFSPPCITDQMPAPSFILSTSVKFPAPPIHSGHSIHLDLKQPEKKGRKADDTAYLAPPPLNQEYIPPDKTFIPPVPEDIYAAPPQTKSPRLNDGQVYLPPQVPPPRPGLLPPSPPNPRYLGPENDLGNTEA